LFGRSHRPKTTQTKILNFQVFEGQLLLLAGWAFQIIDGANETEDFERLHSKVPKK